MPFRPNFDFDDGFVNLYDSSKTVITGHICDNSGSEYHEKISLTDKTEI